MSGGLANTRQIRALSALAYPLHLTALFIKAQGAQILWQALPLAPLTNLEKASGLAGMAPWPFPLTTLLVLSVHGKEHKNIFTLNSALYLIFSLFHLECIFFMRISP